MEQETSTKTDSAAEIVNFPKTVKAFGKEYKVARFTLGPLVRALPHIAPLGYLLRSASKADATDILVNTLALSGEPALGLISVATEEPVEWLEDKDPIEGLRLLTAIVEANVHYFFASENLDQIKSDITRLGKLIEEKMNSGESSTSS